MSLNQPQDFMPWNPEEPKAPVKRKLKPGAKAAFISLGVIFAAIVILFGGLFRIRNITVVGNRQISREEVVRWTGVERGMSFFSVSEEKVRKSMEQNRYLVCLEVVKQLPGSVTVYVEERAARANVHVLGVTYLLDERGMVLERMTGGMKDGLPVVTGLQARDVTVGKTVVAGSEKQLQAYVSLVSELVNQGYLGQVAELKVSDPESLYLLTEKGYTVHLGSGEQLRAKIGTLRAVETELQKMGYRGGVIEASVPAEATYIPAE